tara:strand:+ start:161 stop:460 length:300 start_codon:yes stop_codon:yes gene_type:complete
MAYSEAKVIIGGLAHVPILIFIANLIKGKFETKTKDTKEIKVKKEPIKVIELKESETRKEEVQVREEIPNKLEETKKTEEINKKVKKKKKKKKKNMKRD